jgi:DNA-directed RNA polymerase delta subunit
MEGTTLELQKLIEKHEHQVSVVNSVEEVLQKSESADPINFVALVAEICSQMKEKGSEINDYHLSYYRKSYLY